MQPWPENAHLTDEERVALGALRDHYDRLRSEMLMFSSGTPSHTALAALASAAVKIAAAICEVAKRRTMEDTKCD